ncbi:CoA-binding protein [Bizionia gelidisalsuginis]|uniref:CoA-binding protein n=1 Tax=Bizionia gelidisalsuginis TaxID=291188 RepID=A0ABY3MDI9_9FLAO|nr:CoA-binding protein [Bizionia gelidisalsuginis]TYC17067.1 CoA-binding protein [Bizionia gelidisalsuginis]
MSKKTLVIGASLKPIRYSNMAIQKLTNYKHETVAIGLRGGDINGVSIDVDLKDYKNIDTVTLYLNPNRQEDYYRYIIGLNPKRVIFNPGTENPEFYDLLKRNNIDVEIACTLVLLSTHQY